MKLTDILPNPENPRVLRDEKFAKLKQSIQDFPKMMSLRPIVVDNMGMILGGNMRYRALQDLGFKDIPDSWVKRAEELTAEEKRRFIITDNVGFGKWDFDELSNNWDVEDLEAWGLDVPGFEDEKLEAQEDDYEEPENIQTDIILGDLFQIGKHRLLCGDSTISENIEKVTQRESVDFIFTDPDYSMEDEGLFSCYANTLQLKAKASLWVCSDKQAVKLAMNDFENFSSFFIHDFKVPTLISNTRAMQRHNMIVCFGSCAIKNRADEFATIVPIATERTLESHKVFRMAKRVGLPAAFIDHFTDAGNIIVDIFAHSGSTIVAAHQLQRVCYAIEIDPRYCHLIIDRLLKLDPSLVVLKNGKPYSNIS